MPLPRIPMPFCRYLWMVIGNPDMIITFYQYLNCTMPPDRSKTPVVKYSSVGTHHMQMYMLVRNDSKPLKPFFKTYRVARS